MDHRRAAAGRDRDADRPGRRDTALTAAADIVLPGAAWVEKDALYTNDQGMVQAASRTIGAPGEAREDWFILTNLGSSLGLSLGYQGSVDVRRAIAAAMPGGPYAEAERLAFTRPVPARTGCRRRTRPSAGSGTSCTRICRR